VAVFSAPRGAARAAARGPKSVREVRAAARAAPAPLKRAMGEEGVCQIYHEYLI